MEPIGAGPALQAVGSPSSSDRVSHDRTAAMLYSATEDADQTVVGAVGAVAERLGISRSQVALAWLLSQPGITAPIFGSAKPSHLTEAVAALSITLNATDRAELEAPYVPHAASFYREVPGKDQDR